MRLSSRAMIPATRLAMVLILTALGCVKGGQNLPDAAAQPGGADAASPAGSPQTCEEIRYCIYKCLGNKACGANCVSAAAAAAKPKFQALVQCSLDPCPDQDEQCRCDAECYFGGPCVDSVEDCAGLIDDRFCLFACH